MIKSKIIFLILSLMLIGGSTAIMIVSFQSNYFLSSDNEVCHTITPLRGEPNSLEPSSLPVTTMIPSQSIQDFPEPTVEVYQFTDHEMDLRGYGNDTVRFNMKFRSTAHRAMFYGYAQLWNSSQTGSVSQEAYWEAWVDPNTNTTASFDINGYEIFESNENGPYWVRLRFYKENETTTTVYNSEFVHQTKAYLYSDFQPTPSFGITSSVIDTNANGLFDWVNVHIDLNVVIPDEYYFTGTISGGGRSENARNNTVLSEGPHTVVLKFAAWDFQEMSGPDTITLTDLHIRHFTQPEYVIYDFNPSHSIGSYTPVQFDTPPLKLTGRFSGEGYDTDGDTLHNFYRFVIEVEKLRIEEGEFRLYSDIRINTPNKYIDSASSNTFILNSLGLINVTIDFNGVDIFKSGILNDNFLINNIYGHYYHRPDIGYNWGDSFSFIDEFITSDTHHYLDFENPGASLTHNFYDYGIDTDGDNLYDFLVVDIEVDVFLEGDYYLQAWLETSSNYRNIDWKSRTVHLKAGTHNVSLQYDGVDIWRMAVNDYVRFAYLSFQGGSPLTELDYNNTVILSHYLFTDFDPPRARFTGIFSDTPKDTNSDGFWDELRILVEVEINETGRYRVYGALRNQITSQNKEVTTEPMLVPVGTVSFVLVFPGSWIWSQHMNITYLLDYVYIYEVDANNNDIQQWDYSDNSFTTDVVYDSNKFNAPPVLFTDNFTENLVDIDSDGLYDYLAIEVEIEITQTVNFYILLEGMLDLNGESIYASEWIYNPTVGRHWIELGWFTVQFYQTLKDQTYAITFDLERTDTWELLDRYTNYETNYYAYSEFEPPSAEFTGVFYDYGVDSDAPSDGTFDYLELVFEVDVSEDGEYWMYGYLSADEGGTSFYFYADRVFLSAGIHNFTVIIEPYWFLDHSNGGSKYVNYIYLYQYFGAYGDARLAYDEDNRYLSQTYYHDDFDIPPIAFSDNIFYDYGEDTDENGLYDHITVEIELNVSEAGTYYIYGRIYCGSGGNSFYFSSDHMFLSVGLHNYSLQLDSAWVRNHMDGSNFYIGYMYLYQVTTSGDHIKRWHTENDYYFSRTYYHSELDPPDAWITNVLDFNPVDFDEDGLYDVYQVVFEVNVTVPNIDLRFDVDLSEMDTNIHITSASLNLNDLSIGTHNFTIDFRGDRIHSSGFTNGLQLSHYVLKRIIDWQIIDESFTLYPLTILYSFTDFNSEYFPLIRIIDISVTENQFDQVKIDVAVLRYSSESVDQVKVNTELSDVYYDMSLIYMGIDYEIWTYTYSPPSIDAYFFIVNVTGNFGSEDSLIYQAGGPSFIVFQVNIDYGSIGDEFLFTAKVTDSDGIEDVILHLEGTVYPMNFIRNISDIEIWQVTVNVTQGGTLTAYATATDLIGIYSKSDEITLNIDANAPEIRNFSMNTTLPITLGGAIHFEALIRDSDGVVVEVILVTMGIEYSMNFVESSGLGELWDLEVTYKTAGEHTAYIIAKDSSGFTSQSKILDIIVNEGSVIEGVGINPGTTVKVETEISFSIEIQKSDAIITSVTLEITDDQGNDYLIPLEIIDETDSLEIYGGTYTPTRVGTYECTIRILNTKNQESIYKVTIRVEEEIQISSPGFEMVIALGILALLPLKRKYRKN
ncbi:MAG: hypothetical protein ACFFAE_02880 [Candidatus Hodarchaeota archaeon]